MTCNQKYPHFINLFIGTKTYYHGLLWLNQTHAGCSGVTHKLLFRKPQSHPRIDSNLCNKCKKLNINNHIH